MAFWTFSSAAAKSEYINGAEAENVACKSSMNFNQLSSLFCKLRANSSELWAKNVQVKFGNKRASAHFRLYIRVKPNFQFNLNRFNENIHFQLHSQWLDA